MSIEDVVLKIGGSDYRFKSLTSQDYFRLKDLNVIGTNSDSAVAQLVSKGVLKGDKPIEIHEVSLLDGRVTEKYIAFLNKGGMEVIPLDDLPVEDSERLSLGDYQLSYNPDYVTGDYTRFLSQTAKMPGTAIAGLIRSRLLLDDKKMTPDQVDFFTYSEALALEQYLSRVFTITPDTATS